MKSLVWLGLITVGLTAAGAVPDPVILHMSSQHSHATIAGRLAAKPDAPAGIAVRNGNLMYATVTDPEGRWGIVIRHVAVNVTVQSYSLQGPSDSGGELTIALPR